MNIATLESLISRALDTTDDHSEEVNRDLFFNILNQVHEDGQVFINEAEDYAEPGYELTMPGVPILLANWNSETRWNRETNESETISNLMPLLAKFAEEVNCSIEWSDEWVVCECQKAFRTSPDSYGWAMYGGVIADMHVCGDCIKEDPAEYFEEISGNPRMAITINGLNPENYGYVRINNDSFEYGLYGGQNASSDAIARTLVSAGITEFLFSVDSTGQFDMRFSVYVSEDDFHAAKAVLDSGETTCEVDPAESMAQGLKAATAAMSKLQDGDGVKVATVNAQDGTATARTVSREEFVNGVKS